MTKQEEEQLRAEAQLAYDRFLRDGTEASRLAWHAVKSCLQKEDDYQQREQKSRTLIEIAIEGIKAKGGKAL